VQQARAEVEEALAEVELLLRLVCLAAALERRQRRVVHDLLQALPVEVLLARLLVRVVLAPVLLEALQPVLLLPVDVDSRVEELARLLPALEHVRRREPAGGRVSGRHTCVHMRGRTHPSISTMRVIWLYSDVPGKSGRPRKSSTAMQPSDHMSIAPVYGMPRRTSGER
jgi:hypothetical protein